MCVRVVGEGHYFSSTVGETVNYKRARQTLDYEKAHRSCYRVDFILRTLIMFGKVLNKRGPDRPDINILNHCSG